MAYLSRRRFLEESMLAATAALALHPAQRAFADDAQSTSPNERLRVAVIGVRGQGNGHLGAYSGRQDSVVTVVCDADRAIGEQRCAEVSERQKFPARYVQDLRDVFTSADVDVVSTATPNHWHALVAIWAMQNGKDVYVEKPVSHNVSEGRRMVEVARKYGRICQTGTQCRSQQGTIDAIRYVHEGKIGAVQVSRGLCYKKRPSIGPRGEYQPPASVDYNLWCGPAPMSKLTRPNLHYDWHWVWETGNGDLGNQGIHQMDLARWGLGVDRLCDSVHSYGGRLGYEDAGETANTQIIEHRYGDQKLIFEVRGLPTDPLRGANVGVIFEGTEGYVVLSSYDAGAAFDLKGNMVQAFQGGGDHFGNFLNAVRSRKQEDLAADILEGHLSSALCHLGNISYRLGESIPLAEVSSRLDGSDVAAETFERFSDHLAANQLDLAQTHVQFGRQLQVNPETESFVDCPDADLQLTREYRAPFVVPGPNEI